MTIRQSILMVSVLCASFTIPAMAQDASKPEPVEPAAIQEAPPEVVSSPQGVPAPVITPPEETKKGPRDAITGKPVSPENNPVVKTDEEEPSLRDQVRSKMKN